MKPTSQERLVLLTASGASAKVHIPVVDPRTDRLRVSWCLISAGAATFSGRKIKHLAAYFTKTISTLLSRPQIEEQRELATNWGRTVIYKHRGEISPLAVAGLLVGGRTTGPDGEFVNIHPGMVDFDVQETARILFGHPLPTCGIPQCGICTAIATDDWHIALKLATGPDYELALGALIELYQGALADGLTARAVAPRSVGFSTASTVSQRLLPPTPGLVYREDRPKDFKDRRGVHYGADVIAYDHQWVYYKNGTKKTRAENEAENF